MSHGAHRLPSLGRAAGLLGNLLSSTRAGDKGEHNGLCFDWSASHRRGEGKQGNTSYPVFGNGPGCYLTTMYTSRRVYPVISPHLIPTITPDSWVEEPGDVDAHVLLWLLCGASDDRGRGMMCRRHTRSYCCICTYVYLELSGGH